MLLPVKARAQSPRLSSGVGIRQPQVRQAGIPRGYLFDGWQHRGNEVSPKSCECRRTETKIAGHARFCGTKGGEGSLDATTVSWWACDPKRSLEQREKGVQSPGQPPWPRCLSTAVSDGPTRGLGGRFLGVYTHKKTQRHPKRPIMAALTRGIKFLPPSNNKVYMPIR